MSRWSGTPANSQFSPSLSLTSQLQLPATGEYLAPIFQRAQRPQLLTTQYFPLGLV